MKYLLPKIPLDALRKGFVSNTPFANLLYGPLVSIGTWPMRATASVATGPVSTPRFAKDDAYHDLILLNQRVADLERLLGEAAHMLHVLYPAVWPTMGPLYRDAAKGCLDRVWRYDSARYRVMRDTIIQPPPELLPPPKEEPA